MSPNDTVEERLQRALTEVADSTRVSPDAWARVERRVARRRVPRAALAVAAALGVALVATITVVLVARDDDGPHVTTAEEPGTACGAAPAADVEVMLDPDASAAQRDAIRRLLDESPAVAEASFQSHEDGVRIFRCTLADDPETIATANLTRIPPMFHVSLAEGGAPGALIRRLEGEPGVFDAGLGQCSTPADADIEVFMTIAPTAEQIAGVQTAIEQASGVQNTVFVSKKQVYEEFSCLFVDQPDLVEATSPEALPPSFRVTLEPGADADSIRASLEALDGVDAVSNTRFPIGGPLPEFEPDDFGRPPQGYTEIGAGYDNVGLAWRLSLRTDRGAGFRAIAEFAEGDVAIEGVDNAVGWDLLGTGPSGMAVGTVRPDVARVRIETGGTSLFELETVSTPELQARFFVTHLPAGQTVTVVATDEAGNELYRAVTATRTLTTGP